MLNIWKYLLLSFSFIDPFKHVSYLVAGANYHLLLPIEPGLAA